MSVTLTEKAATEVKKIITEQNLPEGTVLRVGVQGGGCSGFSYSLGFDTESPPSATACSRCTASARRRQEVRPVSGRDRRRLLRRPREAGLRVQQPQRGQELRLRQLVPGLIQSAGRCSDPWSAPPTGRGELTTASSRAIPN